MYSRSFLWIKYYGSVKACENEFILSSHRRAISSFLKVESSRTHYRISGERLEQFNWKARAWRSAPRFQLAPWPRSRCKSNQCDCCCILALMKFTSTRAHAHESTAFCHAKTKKCANSIHFRSVSPKLEMTRCAESWLRRAHYQELSQEKHLKGLKDTFVKS